MKTFIIHISVDAESADRAKEIVEDCMQVGGRSEPISAEGEIFHPGEVAVVLDNVDEIEG